MAFAAPWFVRALDAVAVADGAMLVPDGVTGVVVTVTVVVLGVLVREPSETVREKVRVVAAAGAVKVGFWAVVDDRVTAVPPVWVHA